MYEKPSDISVWIWFTKTDELVKTGNWYAWNIDTPVGLTSAENSSSFHPHIYKQTYVFV